MSNDSTKAENKLELLKWLNEFINSVQTIIINFNSDKENNIIQCHVACRQAAELKKMHNHTQNAIK